MGHVRCRQGPRNPRSGTGPMLRSRRSVRRAPLALAATLTLLLAAALPAGAAQAAPLVLGVNTAGITTDTGAALDAFTTTSGVRPGIAMWYQDFNEGWSTALLNPRFTTPAFDRGATPMVT